MAEAPYAVLVMVVMSAVSEVAVDLWERGYSPIPIMPNSKSPGRYIGGAIGWVPMADWNEYCREQPSIHKICAWSRMTDQYGGGIGIACGRGLICIDIDQEEIVAPLMAILPVAYVQKKGRKGISLFYQGNTEIIRSKNYRTPERIGLVDLLAEGKQTVLPPSIHPDTGEPYRWVSDETLLDVGTAALAILPDDIGEQIGEVLRQFGYGPDGDRDSTQPVDVQRPAPATASARSTFRETNDRALVDLACWVPGLYLYKSRPKPGGFEAVATWRASCSGRPLEQRKRNLSIVSTGIRDFGDGRSYTPIDLVMAAREIDAIAASNWLLEKLPQEPLIFVQGTRRGPIPEAR